MFRTQHIISVLIILSGCFAVFCANSVQALPPCSPQPTVLLIHGFQGKEQDFKDETEILKKIYPQAVEITAWRWEAPAVVQFRQMKKQWKKTIKNHQDAAENLFQEIKAMPQEKQRQLILIGHSLGGSIVIHTLAKCHKEGIKIDHFVLAGAAIANDDPDIELALKAVTHRSYNLVNMQDYALGAYRAIEEVPALGTGCANTLDKNQFCELAFDMESEHDIGVYLIKFQNCAVKDQYQSKIVVPQDDSSIIEGLTWAPLDEYAGWRLQKHRIWRYCRILSPEQECMAKGSQERMTASFEKVKAQLGYVGDTSESSTKESETSAPDAPKAPTTADSDKKANNENVKSEKSSNQQTDNTPPKSKETSATTESSNDTAVPQSAPESVSEETEDSNVESKWSDFITWKTLDLQKGWKLQRGRFSTHYRILNSDHKIVQEGDDEETIRKAFEDKVKTLEEH